MDVCQTEGSARETDQGCGGHRNTEARPEEVRQQTLRHIQVSLSKPVVCGKG